MKTLKLNREFATRHVGVALLMLGLSGWFGYDGFVKYPATPAADLYRSIEGSDAPAGYDLDAFKTQKTQTQYGFAALALLAALVIGGHVAWLAAFKFSFDDEGFVVGGEGKPKRAFADVKKIDWSKWEKKGIVRADGITLDAWHHEGVKEVAAILKKIEEGRSAK